MKMKTTTMTKETTSTKAKDKPSPFPPPLFGKAFSIAFFAVLFGLANPSTGGYEEFRKCHGNCINGILHAIGMPLAVSGVFLVIRAVTDSPDFTRTLQFLVVTGYLCLYLRYESNPYSPWLFYILYLGIFDRVLYQHFYYEGSKWTRWNYLCVGISLIAVNVGLLETIGHGLFEHHHSYVKEFFNSVFHTPLYGINSILWYVSESTDHTCW
mmetsp:Transcript_27611/g.32217  ORF Transcript_27611/g.32217 Transcript_27611/m.32217 type:complete len:211 (-) Transcript_27611:418-1050(-)